VVQAVSKVYTEAQLSDQVAADLTWRLREISDLKTVIRLADPQSQRVLLRAFATICYAHWEGFVRFSARKYMEFIALRKFRFTELDRQFYRNYFLPRINGLSRSSVSVSEACRTVDDVLDSRANRFVKANDDLLNTKSNLNYGVYLDICRVCALNMASIHVDETFIDVVLLKRRNAIAHGEEVLIDLSELDSIADATIAHMRSFKDGLENNIYSKLYRAA
jgi:hypothetical protein